MRKKGVSKENLITGINYICKIYREKESEKKNKPKLYHSRIEKRSEIINNKNDIWYFFKVAHSAYCDEEYIKERNPDLSEWIKRLQKNTKDDIISNKDVDRILPWYFYKIKRLVQN